MWTLDPIDGTKGFLRGGQYAVCLALIIDARVELGVIGCPNLPSTPSLTPSPPSHQSSSTATPDDASASANGRGTGALFVAVRGHGAHQLPLLIPRTPAVNCRRLSMPRLALHELSFLESVEKAHAALDTNARIAARLGVRAEPLRMDSQAKYAALVRGDGGGGVYLRLPVAGGGRGGGAGGYQEKIWVRYECLTLPKEISPDICFRLCMCLCRTTPLGRFLSKKLAESSPIIVGVRSTLVSGARSVRILVWLPRGRRSTRR